MWPFGKSLTQRAEDAINAYPTLKDLGLTISDDHGNLSVSGLAPRQAHKNLIEATLEGLNGVKAVDTSGVVVGQEEVSDAAIAEVEAQVQKSQLAKSVLSALKGNAELKDDPIDVLQSGGNVVLRGAVDSQHEFNLAVKLAQESGATEVDTSKLEIHTGAKSRFAAEHPGYVNTPDEFYTVKAGDSLSAIAQKFYGDASKYTAIAKANGISNPDLIQVGQKLQIPR